MEYSNFRSLQCKNILLSTKQWSQQWRMSWASTGKHFNTSWGWVWCQEVSGVYWKLPAWGSLVVPGILECVRGNIPFLQFCYLLKMSFTEKFTTLTTHSPWRKKVVLGDLYWNICSCSLNLHSHIISDFLYPFLCFVPAIQLGIKR